MFDSIKKYVSNTSHFYLILFITSIFLVIAIHVWVNYISPKINPTYVDNKEYIEGENNTTTDVADLYFFYTVWCPHCKKAKPEWDSFKEELGEGKINGVSINFREIDCDKDTATADKFNVDGYPTIKLVHNNRIIEYDAKPDVNTLRQFLNTSL